VFLFQALSFLFEYVDLILIFADAFEEFSVIFLPFDEPVNEFVSSFDSCMLLDFSESGFDIVERFHLSFHFEF
jgi:hypothetical protein